MNKSPLISEAVLIEEYVNKNKSMKQIAKEQKIAVGSVHKYIKMYGIESRHMTEEIKKKISDAKKGKTYRKGFHLSESHRHKLSQAKKGKFFQTTEFGGHSKQRSDGYISIYFPTHPHSSKDGYVMEHILIMEKAIGRLLEDDEVVHHRNHIRDDNRIENLQLMTFKEHARFHMKERWKEKKGVMTYQ